jgi:UDP-N-acetyl-D-glucosamine dehydrogenase
MTRDTHVAVIGLGYVGLPLAIAFAEAGLDVQGVDLSAERVAELVAGRSPIDDVSDERLAAALDGTLRITIQAEGGLDDADAVVVCVPTPINATKDPDLGPVLAAARFIRDNIRVGQLILLQSTTSRAPRPGLSERSSRRAACWRAATSTSPTPRSA